jgi:hypothetical protein
MHVNEIANKLPPDGDFKGNYEAVGRQIHSIFFPISAE